MRDELEALANRLQDMDYTTYAVPLNEEESIHQLVIDIGEDEALRLTVFFLGDLLALAGDQPGMKDASQQLDESKADFLQYFVRYPFEVKEEAISDTARLIMMMNWSTPMGAFGLNEGQKMVYYRQVFECMDDEPSTAMLAEVLLGMDYYANLRYDTLKRIASGEQTLDDYVRQLKESGKAAEEFPGYDL